MDGELSHCTICDKRFSGILNVKQHYASEGHRKKFRMASESARELSEQTEKRLKSILPFESTGSRRISERSGKQAVEISERFFSSSVVDDNWQQNPHPSTSKSDPTARSNTPYNESIITLSESCDKYGNGRCEVCKVDYTSPEQADQHIRGKRHVKNVKNRRMLRMTNVEGDSDDGKKDDSSDEDEECPIIIANGKVWCDLCKRTMDTIDMFKKHCRDSLKHSKTRKGNQQMVSSSESSVFGKKTTENSYYCNVCNCPLNSVDQVIIHNDSRKHKEKEMRANSYRQNLEPVPSTSNDNSLILKKQKTGESGRHSVSSTSSNESDAKLKHKVTSHEARRDVTIEVDVEKAAETIREVVDQHSTNAKQRVSTDDYLNSIRNNDILKIYYTYICSQININLKQTDGRPYHARSGMSKQTAKQFLAEQLTNDVNRSLDNERKDLEQRREEIRLRLKNAEIIKKLMKE